MLLLGIECDVDNSDNRCLLSLPAFITAVCMCVEAIFFTLIVSVYVRLVIHAGLLFFLLLCFLLSAFISFFPHLLLRNLGLVSFFSFFHSEE